MVTQYTLDTNACVAALRGNVKVAQRVASFAPKELSVLTIVVAELYYGANKSKDPVKNLHLLGVFLPQFNIIDFDLRAAEKFGTIRADLDQRGMKIGPYDMQIAAVALVHDFTLVTHNTSEFSRIPSLALDDWE